MSEKQGVIELPKIEILEIFDCRKAARRALKPGEYARVNLPYDEPNQMMILAVCASITFYFLELVTLGEKAKSPTGNLLVEIKRKNGPKPSLLDYLIYGENRLLKRFL